MKVFLSWSGPLSLKMACAFRDWLPSVIQSVKPYVSSEDIDKGARWSTDIAQELKESSFGIICVTRDNLQEPWVNFEAGALSKTFDKSRVCPFLFNIKRSEVQGPLLQFQSAVYEREDIEKLLLSINASLPDDEKLEQGRLRSIFEVWWPKLKQQLDNLKKDEPPEQQPTPAAGKEATHTILEEILELTRGQTKLLRSPPELLPADYIASVLLHLRPLMGRGEVAFREKDTKALEYLRKRAEELVRVVMKMRKQRGPKPDSEELGQLDLLCEQIRDVAQYLTRDLPPESGRAGRITE